MTSVADFETIDDEDAIEEMIKKTEDITLKMKMRKRQKEIREKRQAERKKESEGKEDAMKMRLRMAEEEKQRKIKELNETAQIKGSGAAEKALKEKHAAADREKEAKIQQLKDTNKNTSSISNPTNAITSGGKPTVTRNPTAIKEMLLNWCKQQVQGYENAFDFSKLNPKNRRGNFKLAFDVAEKLADIAPLLDVEDMVRMKNPDWKCVFTQVQSYYRRFGMQKPNTATSTATISSSEASAST